MVDPYLLLAERPAPDQALEVPPKFWQFSVRDGLLVTTYVAFACALYPYAPLVTFGLAWIAIPGVLRYRANWCTDRTFRNFVGMIVALVGSLAAAALLNFVAFCGTLVIGFFLAMLITVIQWCGGAYGLQHVFDFYAPGAAAILFFLQYAILEYASWPRVKAPPPSSEETAVLPRLRNRSTKIEPET